MTLSSDCLLDCNDTDTTTTSVNHLLDFDNSHNVYTHNKITNKNIENNTNLLQDLLIQDTKCNVNITGLDDFFNFNIGNTTNNIEKTTIDNNSSLNQNTCNKKVENLLDFTEYLPTVNKTLVSKEEANNFDFIQTSFHNVLVSQTKEGSLDTIESSRTIKTSRTANSNFNLSDTIETSTTADSNFNKENMLDSLDGSVRYNVHDDSITDLLSSANIEKSTSLTHLDTIFKIPKHLKSQQRPVSLHEDTLQQNGLSDFLSQASYTDNRRSNDSLSQNSNSIESLSNGNGVYNNVTTIQQHSSPFARLNKQAANNMFRKAVSLCELQNEKVRTNLAKLERKFISTEVISSPDTSENDDGFQRVSYEDCSSCISCRSRTSSYHSLLYDVETASNYQIYQPTVCDVTSESGNESDSLDTCSDVTTKKRSLSFQKEAILKHSQAAIGNFKNRLRNTKSLRS